jgi:hypothetical protein
VGIHDDFFKIGGDSILGAQIVARVRQDFQVELPLFRLFGSPTIAALAEWLETAPRETGMTEGPIPRIPRDGPLPLSFSQQRMWFLTQFEENNPAYVIRMRCACAGPLRVDLLETSLRSVVERHEVLRTTFAIRDGLPVLCIAPDARLDVPLLECRIFLKTSATPWRVAWQSWKRNPASSFRAIFRFAPGWCVSRWMIICC